MNEKAIRIQERLIGSGQPCFTIAEIAQAHDGSLGTAHAYIDAVANAGADAIKFQTHIADAESTPLETFRVNFSKQDNTRYEYWRRMEFTAEQWHCLAEHCRDRGLIFLSSAFSEQAVDLLEELGCPAWKIGSGEVTTLPLIRKMAQTGKPVLLSSGMSTWADLERAVACVQSEGAAFCLFQCTTAYPCPPERWGLNVISKLRSHFHCPVGFSDHSGDIHAGLAAAALGADLLEVHVTFSHECFGPDVPASVTTRDLHRLVDGVRQISTSLTHPIDKDDEAEAMAELRLMFGKSIVAARDLSAGEVLVENDLAFKKPGFGIPASAAQTLIGKRMQTDVRQNTLLSLEHFAY